MYIGVMAVGGHKLWGGGGKRVAGSGGYAVVDNFCQIHINFINLCSAYASKICVQLTKNFLAKTSTKILRYYIQQELDKL